MWSVPGFGLRCTKIVALTTCALAAGLSACSAGTPVTNQQGEGKLLIATTVSPITSIVASIGGDRVSIEGIVPEGSNSHTFEPAPQVVALLSTADVIFVNGLKLEDPTLDLARENMKPGSEIVEIGTLAIPESDYIYDFSFPKIEGKPNPHLWTDPRYAMAYAEIIRDTLTRKDPAHAEYYAANDAIFRKQTNALANALRLDQATVPNGNLQLLTYHDAYAYFARDFGWTVIGAVQPRSFAEPTPAEVAALIEQVKAAGVPTIFGSEVFPSAVLEEIGRAANVMYNPSLRDDDLPGRPGEPEHSWFGLMKYDYTTMIKGLGGTTTNLDALSVGPTLPDTANYPQ